MMVFRYRYFSCGMTIVTTVLSVPCEVTTFLRGKILYAYFFADPTLNPLVEFPLMVDYLCFCKNRPAVRARLVHLNKCNNAMIMPIMDMVYAPITAQELALPSIFAAIIRKSSTCC